MANTPKAPEAPKHRQRPGGDRPAEAKIKVNLDGRLRIPVHAEEDAPQQSRPASSPTRLRTPGTPTSRLRQSTAVPGAPRAGVDELEDAYHAPSAAEREPVGTDELENHYALADAQEPVYDDSGIDATSPPGGEDRQKEKNVPSHDDLAKAERAAGANTAAAPTAIPDDEESWYNAAEKEAGKGWRRWMFNKRRAAAGGGVIGTIVALVAFFSFSAGPLQFVHIAKLMEQFHFISNEDQSNDRAFRLVRDYRYARMGKIENVRLGIVGNHYANKIETRFNEAGIESSYTKLFGFRDGLVIDPEKLPAGSDLADLKGKSQAEIKTYFKDNFNADVKFNVEGLKEGQFFVSTEGLGYRGNTALTRAAVTTAGISKKFSWISARIMGERAGVTWHPIKKIDNAILKSAEDKFLAWKKQQAKTVEKGNGETIHSKTQVDPNDRAATDAAELAQEATDENFTDGEETGKQVLAGDDSAVPKFTEKLSFKVTASTAALAGIACTVRGLGENIDALKQTQLILPLIRYGVEFMALGGQVMTGQGVDLQQLGFFSKYLSDTSTKTSAFDAQSIQSEMGHSPTGPAAPANLKAIGKGNPFSYFTTGAGGAILKPICSAPGQAVQLAISFFGGPISTIVGTGISAALGPTVMNAAAHWLSNDAADVFAKGANAGYNIDYGTRLAANAQATSEGGTVLSSKQSAELYNIENDFYARDFQSKSLATRLFDSSDPRSALGHLVDAGSTSFSSNLAKMGGGLFNFSHMFSSMAHIFSPRALAAPAPYDYGFPAIGFSAGDMSNPLVSNPYQNADQVVNSILPTHADYIKRAQKCFGVIIDPKTYDITSWQGGVPQYNKDGMESGDCTSSSSDWLQTRFYIFDTQTAESAACYQGDEQSCSDVGFNNGTTASSPPTQTGTTSGSGTVETGTNAELAKKILAFKSTGEYNCDSLGDCADLEKTAAGQSIKASSGGNVCQATSFDPRVLQLILYVIEVGKFKIGTSALCGDHHDDGPNGHSGGRAVDFSTVNGLAVNINSAEARTNALDLATFVHNISGTLAPRQLITAGYGNQFDQAFLSLEIPDSATFGGTGAKSTNADHRNHIHAGY